MLYPVPVPRPGTVGLYIVTMSCVSTCCTWRATTGDHNAMMVTSYYMQLVTLKRLSTPRVGGSSARAYMYRARQPSREAATSRGHDHVQGPCFARAAAFFLALGLALFSVRTGTTSFGKASVS